MADRIPLIVNVGAAQIQELPNQDDLVLSGKLKMEGTALGSSDIIVSGGSDAICMIANHNSVSNLSRIGINCHNNAGNASIQVAEFNVVASNAPEFKCFGDITAFASSDKRLKDNITTIPNALSKVLSISGNTFNWNEASPYEGKADTGVIAQEIEKLDLPGVTTIRDDGTHAVKYEKLVPLLIEAIKELKTEVDELKSHTH